MFWNHRMMQVVNDAGKVYEETVLKIVEVYYHDDGSILGWTNGEEVWGEDIDAVRQTLHWMLDATEKPVLIESELLAQAEIAREEGRESLWEPDDSVRLSIDEVLDSLGLERNDIDSWEDDGGNGTYR